MNYKRLTLSVSAIDFLNAIDLGFYSDLVELLTPRSLDQPGPDGRPAIEYVRDVCIDLMSMGEGMRRVQDKGQADIISSDDEDDLEAARRKWPRNPVTGPALAIARMWLSKARKRRTFGKLIRGILDQNKKGLCEICGRSPGANNVRLTCLLATKGVPDINAIDRLILGFEGQYGLEEVDRDFGKPISVPTLNIAQGVIVVKIRWSRSVYCRPVELLGQAVFLALKIFHLMKKKTTRSLNLLS